MKKLIGSIIGIFLIRYVLLPGVQIQMKVVIIPTWFLLQMMDLSDFGGTSLLMREDMRSVYVLGLRFYFFYFILK
jgi:hypothetical protein